MLCGSRKKLWEVLSGGESKKIEKNPTQNLAKQSFVFIFQDQVLTINQFHLFLREVQNWLLLALVGKLFNIIRWNAKWYFYYLPNLSPIRKPIFNRSQRGPILVLVWSCHNSYGWAYFDEILYN